MILCNDIEPKARKKVKRPRACMAVSFITTSVMLSMGASVESVYQPTWSALGLDGSHSNRTTTTNDVVINGSNGKKHDSPQSSVKSEDSSHNNHHKVVRRPRRDEGDSRIEVDGHTDHLRDESTSKGKAKMRSETANNDSVSESPQISLDLPEQKKSQASVDPGKSRQERRTHPANSSHGTIDQDFKIGLFPYEIPEIDETQQFRLQERFMSWCKEVGGIYTVLAVQTFEYVDYMNSDPVFDLEDDINDRRDSESNETNLPVIRVRGLAASADIKKGDVVIRIPLKALWSLTTIIDSDPVLGGNVMGPSARERHGWDAASDEDEVNTETDESSQMDRQFYEMPLLAVALLYHVQLGQSSNYAPYIDILKSTPVDSMPFLWSAHRLKTSTAASEGVRTVARGIRQEMRDMYDAVVQVLITQHPSIFGKDIAQRNSQEWMYSYEKFKWAFAIVNSRHWQLPIEDFEVIKDHAIARAAEESLLAASGSASVEQVPPAATPTENWVQEHGDVDDEFGNERDDSNKLVDASHQLNPLSDASHSFLAPLADLMNFGPPCTRGQYNKDSHTFEIIASCNFRKGEEVTFWYSDECHHVIMGIYGFSHPLIPACPTSEDLRLENAALEARIGELFTELDRVEKELDYVEDILIGCECCGHERRSAQGSSATALRNESPSVRGFRSRKSMKRRAKSGVRRMYSGRSEF